MLETPISTVNHDVNSLVKDAQALFSAAAALTGVKAEEMRTRGMHLLDTALSKGKEVQASAIVSGKEMVASTDDYVKQNPWRAIAAAAGVGLLLGALIGRK